MDNHICAGYIFSANFDSGNLHKVELVNYGEDVEFNLWTRPDCAGTPYENTNRSWFFFCVQGGDLNKVCKFNVVNLNKQVKLFNHGMQPAVRVGENGKWERLKENLTYKMSDGDFAISFHHNPKGDISTKYFYAFTFPYTYTELQTRLAHYDGLYQKPEAEVDEIIAKLKAQQADHLAADAPKTLHTVQKSCKVTASSAKDAASDLKDEIYYHRELLIESVEKRRIDLVTITSFHNIEAEREHRFSDLFPDTELPRSKLFRDKKVIFISSRVHPGETPASFVLNGFLKAILDRKSRIASTLRKMYVFKVVPFLNPDGVFNGFYRSDTLGHNLNRVYISPNPQTQPSIYAVRKLIKYYHDKSRADSPETSPSDAGADEADLLGFAKNENVRSELFAAEENICAEDVLNSNTAEHLAPFIEVSALSDVNENEPSSSRGNFGEEFILDVPAATRTPEAKKTVPPLTDNAALCSNQTASSLPIRCKPRHKLFGEKIEKKKGSISLASSINSVLNSKAKTAHRNRFARNADRLEKCDQANAVQEKSDIILYMDLHGHASKKGIFMYGNHLPNVAEAVECMLLPRLMSINCQHFQFDACVFSERNMYMRGKRDGLSKEGSGRVAIYKAIGLIKCYTLESNYNTGKYVNVLPLAKNVKSEKSGKKMKLVPPKYTPAIYEEVGKALLPSILDLTDSNPASRLRNSEFRTLNGLRDSLRSEALKLLEPRNSSGQKDSAGRQKLPYLGSALECRSDASADTSKENNCRIEEPPNTFAKLKPATLAILSAQKKKKVLCDLKAPHDGPKIQHIPNKRSRAPKVVLNKKFIIDRKTDPEKRLRVKRQSKMSDASDADAPCCSHQFIDMLEMLDRS